jgi:hypothetical protein
VLLIILLLHIPAKENLLFEHSPHTKRKKPPLSPSADPPTLLHSKNGDLPLDISLIGLTLDHQIALVRQRYFQEVDKYTQDLEIQLQARPNGSIPVSSANIDLLIDKLYQLVKMKKSRSRFKKR